MTQLRPQVRPIDTAATLLMIFLTFSWGVNQVAIKLSNAGFNPMLVLVGRSLLGGGLVWLWCLYRRVPLFSRDGTLWAGIICGLLFTGEFVLIYIGLDFTSAARSVLMINTMPFFVLIGSHLFLGERASGLKLLGLILAFGGVALVLSDQLSLPNPRALIGDALCLGAGALWAATLLYIRGSRLRDLSGEKVLMYQLAVSAIILIPAIPLAGPFLREPSATAIYGFLFQSVLVVAITFPIWFTLIRSYPASGLSSFAFLSPAFGVMAAALFLGDPVTIHLVIALVLIAIGLVLVNRPARPVAQAS